MELKNYNEEALRRTLNEILEKDRTICRCEHCKLDVLAIALNQLPPRYVVADTGYVYAKLNEMLVQFNVDLTVALMRAMQIVGRSPRH
ncbi:MAG: late competence development ComFB family protein [Armatimonadetes bacterium]|nr:late competence development ComFB family protein [Armatimonadota bacterium]